jgi:hypothetical protein
VHIHVVHHSCGHVTFFIALLFTNALFWIYYYIIYGRSILVEVFAGEIALYLVQLQFRSFRDPTIEQRVRCFLVGLGSTQGYLMCVQSKSHFPRASQFIYFLAELMQPSFSLFVLGTGGGPLETNLSSYVCSNCSTLYVHKYPSSRYLCKTYDSTWEDGVFALEAGLFLALPVHSMSCSLLPSKYPQI